MADQPARTLAALLLNPAAGTGAITTRRVQVAAGLLGCESFIVANLVDTRTRNLHELSAAARDWQPWQSAQQHLAAAIGEADDVLLAWGLGGTTGPARLHAQRQVTWVHAQIRLAGHSRAWCLDGEPRHPSRWHQYVSDRYARTAGGSFADRLKQVLLPISIH